MKGSRLSPQDFSRLRVEVSLWVSSLNTSVSKQSHACINEAQRKSPRIVCGVEEEFGGKHGKYQGPRSDNRGEYYKSPRGG